jgi:hypothetical protein
MIRTIEERLRTVQRFLTIVQSIDIEDGDSPRDVVEAIREYARDAYDEIYYVYRLPGIVVNLPAPTDDDVRETHEHVEIDTALEEILAAAMVELLDARYARKAGGAK